jgi:GT2 family glycosyltransferase
VIVVDNASTDQSLNLVVQGYPQIQVIRNAENAGFCYAHNQAIRASKGAYYLPLNPDATLQPDYLSALVSALEDRPDYGSAAGKLLVPAEDSQIPRLDSTGLFIDRQRRQYLRGYGEKDTGQFDHAEEVFGADGAAPLYRRETLEDIRINGQYFDESFFIHKEDVDLAWRARLFGWRCWYTPEAAATHQRFFRPSRRWDISPILRVHAVKNRYLLMIKNESRQGWRRDALFILWYDFKILGYLCLFERSSWPALKELRQCWPRARHWRREIWKRVRADPVEMLRWFK